MYSGLPGRPTELSATGEGTGHHHYELCLFSPHKFLMVREKPATGSLDQRVQHGGRVLVEALGEEYHNRHMEECLFFFIFIFISLQ